ncbi:MAG: lipid-A-disaccharide synthase [Bacteroidales bacterium]|nr:lipid-A-disaccharide synthase [Bacteroidales bacterium]
MKYYLIAGEASGDLHGANLMRALREQDPDAQFRFWGGDLMAAVGGMPVRHIRDLAIMGFVEVVAHLGTVLGNIRFCKQDILDYRPDVVVGIDYPGFNLKIEAWAHKHGLKTVHYISPNLWAWKKGRIKGMRKTLDRLCYILPFEERFFAENQMPQAVYVGHPLLDAVRGSNSTEALSSDNHLHYTSHSSTIVKEQQKNSKRTDKEQTDSQQLTVVLLPGSRRQELKHSLPLMVQLADRHPEYRFVVAGMSLLGPDIYRSLIPAESNVEVVYDQTYPLLASAHAAIVCSGTATLETALFDVPQVVCYRANPISIAIAKAIVSRRIRYISLVNLIADGARPEGSEPLKMPVVTELIQEDFNAGRLEREFQLIADDEANRRRMRDEYAAMRALLGNGGASRRTADTILNLLNP